MTVGNIYSSRKITRLSNFCDCIYYVIFTAIVKNVFILFPCANSWTLALFAVYIKSFQSAAKYRNSRTPAAGGDDPFQHLPQYGLRPYAGAAPKARSQN